MARFGGPARARAKRQPLRLHGFDRSEQGFPRTRSVLRAAHTIPQTGGEPFQHDTSMAILADAPARRYRPEEIPFTSRNWDNRLPDYLYLSNRLGLRTCGIWGGWSAKSPYAPEAPNIEICATLGMGVITGTPAHTIEQGEKTYSAESAAAGRATFCRKIWQDPAPLHQSGQRAPRNRRARTRQCRGVSHYLPGDQKGRPQRLCRRDGGRAQ